MICFPASIDNRTKEAKPPSSNLFPPRPRLPTPSLIISGFLEGMFVSSLVLFFLSLPTRMQPVLNAGLFVFPLLGRDCLAVDLNVSEMGKSGSRVNGWGLTSGCKVFGGNENASADLTARRDSFSMPLLDNALCILYTICIGFGSIWEVDSISQSSVRSCRSFRLMRSGCILIFRANSSFDQTTSRCPSEAMVSAASILSRPQGPGGWSQGRLWPVPILGATFARM